MCVWFITHRPLVINSISSPVPARRRGVGSPVPPSGHDGSPGSQPPARSRGAPATSHLGIQKTLSSLHGPRGF